VPRPGRWISESSSWTGHSRSRLPETIGDRSPIPNGDSNARCVRPEAVACHAPADPLTKADRTDHRIDTGADRSPWPLVRTGDVRLVRAKSLGGLIDRHLHLARETSEIVRRVIGLSLLP
jgi:hypothetical protein